MDRTAVRFDRIHKRFGATEALRGFSGSVPEGSVTALLGRNGAGKTTALKCLIGLLAPDDGDVWVLGRPRAALDVETRRRIGFVSERMTLDRRFTVGEAIAYASFFYPTWDDALARDLSRRLSLDPDARIENLSLGQSRKVVLLVNLAFRPALLVLDEPAANFDAVVRREFLEVVLDLFRAEGMAVILSTHLLNDVERIADRVMLIEGGRLRLEAGLDDLKERVKTLRIAPRNGAPLGDLALPGAIRSRRLGDELLVTIEDARDGAARRRAEEAGARVDVVDLPLEEIFIAYGSDEPRTT